MEYWHISDDSYRLPSTKHPQSFSNEPNPVNFQNGQIVYGPYTDVSPFSAAKLHVHYPYNTAYLVAKSYAKAIEISHWGANVAVQEDYEVHHKGAA